MTGNKQMTPFGLSVYQIFQNCLDTSILKNHKEFQYLPLFQLHGTLLSNCDGIQLKKYRSYERDVSSYESQIGEGSPFFFAK